MRIGDRVRLIGIPPDAHDCKDLPTLTVFKKCLGRTFTVKGVERVKGIPGLRLARLEVGPTDVIWVEPEFLEIIGVIGGENLHGSKRPRRNVS